MADDGIDNVRKLMGAAEDVDLPDEITPDHDAPDDSAPPDDAPPAIDPDTIRRACGFPLNDFGNGQRFALYFGEDVIWVPRVGWFVWNGKMWRKDPDEIEVRRRAQQIAERVEAEVPYLVLSDRQMELLAKERDLVEERKSESNNKDDDGNLLPDAKARIDRIDVDLMAIGTMKKRLADLRKGHRRFAQQSGNSARIANAYMEAGTMVARQLDELDADPLMINTDSGILRFKVTGGDGDGMSRVAEVERIDHDRAHLVTKAVAASYDPDATAPGFMAFLERIMPAAEMRRFLQRWFGLCMTALTGEQKLVFLYGAGANGKSVLVDLMARILGDYGATAKIESLIGRNRRSGGDATPDLIPLVGARFVRASEPEEGERLQEAKIKELTGGEPMLARGLNADFFEFLPLFKLTISGNHKPDIRGTDDGIWRRLLLVPFDVQIPKAERDPDLVQKLYEERDGILNWLVEGLLDYLENGLQEPEAVMAATQEYRDESDPMGTMLTECAVVSGSETDFMTAKDLIEAFQFWQEERGETRWGNRTCSLRLKEKADRNWRHPGSGRSFIAGKSGVTGYRGIRLTDVFADRFANRPQHTRSSRADKDFPS
ncbi:phage/plasmid primase, P4 family [Defluviimonas aestuarii]|uniref:phage/plasmid primase, P4 family n=1 Tax=Albidovulum aestuarii TaxID=1130726 RepID=UPI00249C0236|nr:phage/plasmid primase, P4 family [Defluviimonas aestuarii]MDI3335880.1 phage/plasmid primase, P4 family [Defluviimonas aestuarii]